MRSIGILRFVKYNAVQCNLLPPFVPYHALYWYVYAVQYSTVQYSTEVQYNTVQQNTAVLYGRGWLYYV